MKIKNMIILIVLFLLIPLNPKALTGTVNLSCQNTNLSPNSTATCTISFNSSEIYNSFHANIVAGPNMSISSVTKGSTWQGENSTALDLSGDPQTGNKTVATFVIKAGNISTGASTNVSVTDIQIADENFSSQQFPNNQVNIKILSSINTLNSLSISGGNISFNKSQTSYNVTVNASSTNISGSVTDSKSKVSGFGTKKLNYGNNYHEVVVTSESGEVKKYTINITRPDNRSKVNNLKSLSVSEGKINFNENTTSYNIDVGKDVTSIKIDASLKDSKSSFVNGYGPRTVNLNRGTNVIQIQVRAENEAIKTYTINVTKPDNRSSENSLKTLTLSSGKLKFKEDETTYNVKVDSNITSIKVEATLKDEKSSFVDGSGPRTVELKEGSNEIKIEVKAENESIKTYIINVIRGEDNLYLTDLKIKNHKISFDKDKINYTITLNEGETELEIETKVFPENATVTITNNKNLQPKDIVEIELKTEDGTTKTYYIKIKSKEEEKEIVEENNNTKITLKTSLIVFIIGLISFIISIIYRKNKLKKIQEEDNEVEILN